MAKQAKRPTRRQKIEASRLAKVEEAQKLKTAAGLLQPQRRLSDDLEDIRKRNFIGQKKETDQ